MRFFSIIALFFALMGCDNSTNKALTVGTIAGPETELVETAKEVALKKYHLHIKIVEFNDYNLPNEALQDGSLDANVYQHLPYLQAATKARDYKFEVIGKTFLYPTGIYSAKYKDINNVPDNAIVAIPNDPSNATRALLLLQKADLITLSTQENPSIADIRSNPKQLQFKELDAAQLPRTLGDVDAAVINTNFAIPAGLNPARDALFLENKDSVYANLIVIRSNTKKKRLLRQFVKAMNSQEVKEKAQYLFGEAAIPAW